MGVKEIGSPYFSDTSPLLLEVWINYWKQSSENIYSANQDSKLVPCSDFNQNNTISFLNG